VQAKIRSLSNVAERCGGVVDVGAGRWQAEALACRWATAAAFLLWFLGPAVKRKGQRNGGRRRHCGGKKSKLPPPRIYTEEARVVGIVGVFHYPDCSCSESPRGGTEWGGVPVTVPLGHDGEE
jgi:hypothetical protein